MNKSVFLTISIVGGLLSATLSLLHLTSFPGLFLFSSLAPLPLFLLGLGFGLNSLYGAGLVAIIFTFLLEGPLFALNFLVFSFLGPAFLTNRALLNKKQSSGKIVWYPASLLLRDTTFISAIVMLLVLGVYLYFTHGGDIQTTVKNLLATFDSQRHIQNVEPLLIKVLPFLPGFFAFFWAMMMLMNATLAQGLLLRFKQNLRPSPSFEGIEAPKNFIIALGIFLLLSMIGVGHVELLGKNAAFVLAFPFFIAGLGVIHTWLHRTSYPTLGLATFYVVLSFFIWLALLVMLLGILKPWIEKPTLPN